MKYLGDPSSGSQAGTTASRNRFGQYKRTRAIPVNPKTTQQMAVRARMAANAAAWRTLTAGQRAGWADLGISMTRSDALGSSYTLNGFLAYCSVNNNNLTAGNAIVADAPGLVTPSAVVTAVLTLTAASFSIAYTVTPLPAGARLFTFCSPQRSAGVAFEGDYRLISVSAAAAASPAVVLTAYTAKFGVPIVGNRIFVSLQVYLTGFLSGPLITSQVVA
jgi:endoglucanase Acf2